MEVASALKGFVRGSPIGALSLFGLSAAMIFNCGYFFVVGLPFMSLFPVQEHIVFALSGAVISILLGSTLSIFPGILNIVIGNIDAVKSVLRHRDRIAKDLMFISAISSMILFLFFGVYSVASKYYDRGGVDLAALFIFWIFIASIVLSLIWIFKHKKSPGNGLALGIVFSIAGFFFISGLFYGSLVLFDEIIRASRSAVLPDGRSASVIRLGTEFSLVSVDTGAVFVVQTEKLSQISSRLNVPPF